MTATKLATLFAHDDGRHAVWPGVESPPWTHGDPGWHRVGPVDVDAIATPQCLAQIEEPAQPVAEICSASHDDAQFGERDIKLLRDISGFDAGAAPAAAAGPVLDVRAIAAAVCQRVAELPDRNSPEDWPEAMLVTGQELIDVVTCELEQAQAAPQGVVAWMHPETLDVIHDERKQAWTTRFGIGGRAKAKGYTIALVRADASVDAPPGWKLVPVEASEAMLAAAPLPPTQPTAAAPAAVAGPDMASIPHELLVRAVNSLGSFVGDEGWAQSDMDTFDDLCAAMPAADLSAELNRSPPPRPPWKRLQPQSPSPDARMCAPSLAGPSSCGSITGKPASLYRPTAGHTTATPSR